MVRMIYGAVTPEESNILNYGAWCIEHNVTDMIGLGRQSFADPYLPKKLEEDKEDDIKYCRLCDACLELLIQQSKVGCCVYDKNAAQELIETRKVKGKLKISHT